MTSTCTLAIALVFLVATNLQAQNPPPERLPADSVPYDIVQPESGAKSLRVKFQITADAVVVQGVGIAYGRSRTYLADPDLFRIDLKGFQAESLARIQTYDPRGIRVYSGDSDTTFGEQAMFRSTANGEFIVPFIPKLSSLQFTDASGTRLGAVHVALEVKAFCETASTDLECTTWLSDLAQDQAAPVVVCGASDGRWHAENVAIGCGATDEGSGLAEPADAAFSLSTTVADGTETAVAATGSRSVCDVGGNCGTAGPVGGMMIDRKAPVITIGGSANNSVNATTPSGATVEYEVTATDGSNAPVAIACTVPAGSVFPIGTTAVGCTATDMAGNSSEVAFKVSVIGAVDQIIALVNLIRGAPLPPALAARLAATLESALADPQKVGVVCDTLRAFIRLVESQPSRVLQPVLAIQLVTDAARVRRVLGCI